MKKSIMPKTDFVASIAVVLGLAATLGCVVNLPLLCQKSASVRSDLETGMDEFKMISDETWQKIISARQERLVKKRQANETSIAAPGTQPKCQCYESNPCPPGPPGPAGVSGADGEPGAPGKKGSLGEHGIVGQLFTVDITSVISGYVPQCRKCPPGTKGIPGKPGPDGLEGSKGKNGDDGNPGKPAKPGPQGPPGSAGAPGLAGKPGEKGRPGNDVTSGQKGPPGPAGVPGEPGVPGPPGERGQKAKPGAPGPQGPPGPVGDLGIPGSPSSPGPIGKPGPPGKDARYCPCPVRTPPYGGTPAPEATKPPPVSEATSPAPISAASTAPPATEATPETTKATPPPAYGNIIPVITKAATQPNNPYGVQPTQPPVPPNPYHNDAEVANNTTEAPPQTQAPAVGYQVQETTTTTPEATTTKGGYGVPETQGPIVGYPSYYSESYNKPKPSPPQVVQDSSTAAQTPASTQSETTPTTQAPIKPPENPYGQPQLPYGQTVQNPYGQSQPQVSGAVVNPKPVEANNNESAAGNASVSSPDASGLEASPSDNIEAHKTRETLRIQIQQLEHEQQRLKSQLEKVQGASQHDGPLPPSDTQSRLAELEKQFNLVHQQGQQNVPAQADRA